MPTHDDMPSFVNSTDGGIPDDIQIQSSDILREHLMIVDSNDEYLGARALKVNLHDNHEMHISEHGRFLFEHGSDMRIHDRATFKAHIKLHGLTKEEKTKILRSRSVFEAEDILEELFR